MTLVDFDKFVKIGYLAFKMSGRREYALKLQLNGKSFSRLVIDPHYEENHPDMNDQIIIGLVSSLNHRFHPIATTRDNFKFLVVDPLWWKGKPYRLILTYCEDDFLGVVNAFRVKEKEK